MDDGYGSNSAVGFHAQSRRPRRSPLAARRRSICTVSLQISIRGELAVGRDSRTATLYSVRSAGDLDHEAAIRFECEAPRRRAHSSLGILATAFLVSPPPRILTDDVRACDRRLSSIVPSGQRLPQAARRIRPSGTAPVVTSRQNAISSLRARATISVLRRVGAASVR
jgi:hypothetical protein